jgi:hypothetical protein
MPSRIRLPRPAPGTTKWWVIGTIGILAASAVAVWFGLAATVGRASWETVGYQVLDDQTVTITFSVHRPEGRALTCTVEALARDFSPVGRLSVPVPAGPDDVTRTTTLRTASRAVTAQVRSCS